jgi:hypothetical protein
MAWDSADIVWIESWGITGNLTQINFDLCDLWKVGHIKNPGINCHVSSFLEVGIPLTVIK